MSFPLCPSSQRIPLLSILVWRQESLYRADGRLRAEGTPQRKNMTTERRNRGAISPACTEILLYKKCQDVSFHELECRLDGAYSRFPSSSFRHAAILYFLIPHTTANTPKSPSPVDHLRPCLALCRPCKQHETLQLTLLAHAQLRQYPLRRWGSSDD